MYLYWGSNHDAKSVYKNICKYMKYCSYGKINSNKSLKIELIKVNKKLKLSYWDFTLLDKLKAEKQ